MPKRRIWVFFITMVSPSVTRADPSMHRFFAIGWALSASNRRDLGDKFTGGGSDAASTEALYSEGLDRKRRAKKKMLAVFRPEVRLPSRRYFRAPRARQSPQQTKSPCREVRVGGRMLEAAYLWLGLSRDVTLSMFQIRVSGIVAVIDKHTVSITWRRQNTFRMFHRNRAFI